MSLIVLLLYMLFVIVRHNFELKGLFYTFIQIILYREPHEKGDLNPKK